MGSPWDKLKDDIQSVNPFAALQPQADTPEELIKIKNESIDMVKVIVRQDVIKTESSFLGRDTSSQKKPVLFKIASISKAMMAALVYRLHEIGILNLDANVTDYIDYVDGKLSDGARQCKFPDLSDVSIDHLLRQTSGLQEYLQTFNDEPPASKNATRLDALSCVPQEKFSDGKFHYANTNYQLVGMILSKIDHKKVSEKCPAYQGNNVADLLRFFVFEPCGMNDSFLHTENGDKNIPWEKVHGGIILKDENTIQALSYEVPTFEAGGVIASMQDVAKFWYGLFNGKILKPSSLQAMLQEHPAGKIGDEVCYVAGIEAATTSTGEKIYQHYGNLPGSDSRAVFVPDESGGTAFATILTSRTANKSNSIEREMKEISSAYRIVDTADLQAETKVLSWAYQTVEYEQKKKDQTMPSLSASGIKPPAKE